MDRRKRKTSRHGYRAAAHSDVARAIDAAITRAGIPDVDKDAFLGWAVGHLWQTFKTERMNQRIIIDNEIKGLGIRLPNGTVNKEYLASFELPICKISDVELTGADDLGLVFAIGEDGTCTLSGRPSKSGDFTLKLLYGTVEGEERSELSIPVAFNPNPRDLWRKIPTDKNIPYYKPDFEAEYVKVEAAPGGEPRKDMVAASQRGRSHAQEGKARDDHFRLLHCPDSDWYVMAVADGAGSAKYSRKGSQVACDTVVNHCEAMLADNKAFEAAIRDYGADTANVDKRNAVTRFVYDIVFKGAVKAHEAVNKLATLDESAMVKDFNTTLMFAICKKYDFGWFLASFWVGDGAMCLYDAQRKTAKLLGTPDEGEFSGQTRFLTMPGIFRESDAVSKRLRMAIVPDFTALFLMSDGVSDPMFETDKNLNDYAKWEDFCSKLKNGFPEDEIGGVDLSDDNAGAKDQLLAWLDFWSPGNHDDRTIAILY